MPAFQAFLLQPATAFRPSRADDEIPGCACPSDNDSYAILMRTYLPLDNISLHS